MLFDNGEDIEILLPELFCVIKLSIINLFHQIGLNKLWYIGVVPLLITWIVFYLTLVCVFALSFLLETCGSLYVSSCVRALIQIVVFEICCIFLCITNS